MIKIEKATLNLEESCLEVKFKKNKLQDEDSLLIKGAGINFFHTKRQSLILLDAHFIA